MAITNTDNTDGNVIEPLIEVPDTIPQEVIDDANVKQDKAEDQTEVFTLADAIREGAKLVNGQTTGHYFDDEGNACALGAAYAACVERGLV
jgi:hypothetical protein